MTMRPLLFAALLAVGAMAALAQEPDWRTAPLPAEVQRLNREAAAAADPAEAARLYAQSLRQAANGPALEGLGHALLRLDRPADSLAIFQRLDALHPGDPAILTALATAISRLPALRRADLHAGYAHVARAIEIDPDRPEAWHVLSVLHFMDGDYAEAAEAARHAVALDALSPDTPETTARYQQQENACNLALWVFSPLD